MIFTGRTKDGSDAFIAKGMFVSSCSNYWGSEPFTREQKAWSKAYDHCVRYNKSFSTLYSQLTNGSKENLPKWVRSWFITSYNDLEEIKINPLKINII